MRTHNNLMPSAVLTKFKNTIWALPYLAVMGMIWGYLAAAGTGLIIGLLIATVTSIIISKAGKL